MTIKGIKRTCRGYISSGNYRCRTMLNNASNALLLRGPAS